MQFKGLEFDIKIAMGAQSWVWTVYTPRPKQGFITGSREAAIAAAHKAIIAWCYKNPAVCEPATSEPVTSA
jgi:hypothetical protein